MKTRREVWLHLMGHAMAGLFANAEWRVSERNQIRNQDRQGIITEAARSADEAMVMFEDRFGHSPYDGPFTLTHK